MRQNHKGKKRQKPSTENNNTTSSSKAPYWREKRNPKKRRSQFLVYRFDGNRRRSPIIISLIDFPPFFILIVGGRKRRGTDRRTKVLSLPELVVMSSSNLAGNDPRSSRLSLSGSARRHSFIRWWWEGDIHTFFSTQEAIKHTTKHMGYYTSPLFDRGPGVNYRRGFFLSPVWDRPFLSRSPRDNNNKISPFFFLLKKHFAFVRRPFCFQRL